MPLHWLIMGVAVSYWWAPGDAQCLAQGYNFLNEGAHDKMPLFLAVKEAFMMHSRKLDPCPDWSPFSGSMLLI